MLDHLQRQDRYFVQNGGGQLTPKQVRRIAHKARHQSQEASARREGAALIGDRAARSSARTAR